MSAVLAQAPAHAHVAIPHAQVVGHYGFEADEEGVVIFVGVVPVVIDVFFKYWIFIGLNKISPGAVVTIKQASVRVCGGGGAQAATEQAGGRADVCVCVFAW